MASYQYNSGMQPVTSRHDVSGHGYPSDDGAAFNAGNEHLPPHLRDPRRRSMSHDDGDGLDNLALDQFEHTGAPRVIVSVNSSDAVRIVREAGASHAVVVQEVSNEPHTRVTVNPARPVVVNAEVVPGLDGPTLYVQQLEPSAVMRMTVPAQSVGAPPAAPAQSWAPAPAAPAQSWAPAPAAPAPAPVAWAPAPEAPAASTWAAPRQSTPAAVVTTQPTPWQAPGTASVTRAAAAPKSGPASWASKQPKHVPNSPPADPTAVFQGKYIETFTIGGGTHWIYALFLFMLEVLVLMENAGVPAAGQAVDAMKYLMEFPFFGAIIKTALGANTRHAYKITAAYEHPPLRDFWHPTLGFYDRCCKGVKEAVPPTENDAPFPQREHNVRGTPEYTPFTDFNNAIYANERGWACDTWFNAGKRGFRLRFKTGTRLQGGQTLFNVRRKSPTTVCGYTYHVLREIFCCVTGCRVYCPCCAGDAPSEQPYVIVTDASGAEIGRCRQSKQMTWSETLCRTRFNKYARPKYDIIDHTGAIIYTVIQPISKYKFLYICCEAFTDEDYLAIVPGPRNKSTRYCGADQTDKVGWSVGLVPLYSRTIDRCLERMRFCVSIIVILTAGIGSFLEQIMRVIDAYCVFFRTCPVDNCTQVPNPGPGNLRGALPCSHSMSAVRTFFPPGASERDRMLIMAFNVQADMESAFLGL